MSEARNLRWISLSYIKPWKRYAMLLSPEAFGELGDYAKRSDVIYFNNALAFQDLILLLTKLRSKRVLINGYHSSPYLRSISMQAYNRFVSFNAIKWFDAHHVLNSQDRQMLLNDGLKNVHLIPNGVNTERFRPTQRTGHTHAKFNVLYMGKMSIHKGVDLMFTTVHKLNEDPDTGKHIDFTFAGSGPLEPRILQLQKQNENVKFLGQVPYDRLPHVYADSDLVVIPSRIEAFSLVTLEAQSSGLPVVATDTQGPRDIIKDGITGSLIPSENPLALAFSIKHYFNLWKDDFELYKKTCKAARENAEKRFDWNIIAVKIDAMMKEVYAG
jgi:glycosyltransferase involved in cell wall biosynthesis